MDHNHEADGTLNGRRQLVMPPSESHVKVFKRGSECFEYNSGRINRQYFDYKNCTMKPLPEATRTARLLLISLSGALSLSIIGAPLLASHAHPLLSAILYLVFSPVCHQMPQRSFALQGLSWAVCQRCAGIYFGLFAGSLLPLRWWPSALSVAHRRFGVFLAAAPLLLDVALPGAGIWTNTPASRFLTGLLFGAMLMSLVLPGAAEFLRTIRMRRPVWSQPTETEGGVS